MSDNLTVTIDNPVLLGMVCGPNDINLKEIGVLLASSIRTRGNEILIQTGDDTSRRLFRNMLECLVKIAEGKQNIDNEHIRSVYASLESGESRDDFQENVICIPSGKTKIYPRSHIQSDYIRAMSSKDLVFCTGPAGTGKTYLAVAHALMEFLSKKKRKIVLTRPVVETGENLGFLPGDLTQKLAPYLRPLYDGIEDLMNPEMLDQLHRNGQIEVAPLAYMRGRNLKNSYIVLDEAQNTTIEQMKMFLTRIGEGSRAIVTGDLTQIDLPQKNRSGLADAVEILEHLEDVAVLRFSSSDVVRHPLIRKIIDAYEGRNYTSK